MREGSQDIVLRAVDDYPDGIPLATGMAGETMLAVRMNGEALPRDHGYPARLLVPGLFGLENVKWVAAVEVAKEDYRGYWQQRGWDDTAVVSRCRNSPCPITARDSKLMRRRKSAASPSLVAYY